MRPQLVGYLVPREGAGQVVATYRRTICLKTNGFLWSIQANNTSITPTSIILSGSLPRVCVGQKAIWKAGALSIGDWNLDVGHIWSPPSAPGWTGLSTRGVERLAGYLDRSFVDLSRLGDVNEASAVFLRSVIGSGDGLTPSADDVLVGYLAGLYRSREERVISFLQRVLPDLLAYTTELSAHFLRMALGGHFALELLNVADAALAAARRLPHSLVDLLSVGHSSGAAAACGLAQSLRFVALQRKKQYGIR